MPAIAYYLLQKAIMRKQGPNSVLANALGSDIKGKISPILYVMGIVLAFVSPWLSVAMYVLVAVMWLIPDRRIERILHAPGSPTGACARERRASKGNKGNCSRARSATAG
jgi:hypothetical protein